MLGEFTKHYACPLQGCEEGQQRSEVPTSNHEFWLLGWCWFSLSIETTFLWYETLLFCFHSDLKESPLHAPLTLKTLEKEHITILAASSDAHHFEGKTQSLRDSDASVLRQEDGGFGIDETWGSGLFGRTADETEERGWMDHVQCTLRKPFRMRLQLLELWNLRDDYFAASPSILFQGPWWWCTRPLTAPSMVYNKAKSLLVWRSFGASCWAFRHNHWDRMYTVPHKWCAEQQANSFHNWLPWILAFTMFWAQNVHMSTAVSYIFHMFYHSSLERQKFYLQRAINSAQHGSNCLSEPRHRHWRGRWCRDWWNARAINCRWDDLGVVFVLSFGIGRYSNTRLVSQQRPGFWVYPKGIKQNNYSNDSFEKSLKFAKLSIEESKKI